MDKSLSQFGRFTFLEQIGHFQDLYTCYRVIDERNGRRLTLRIFNLRRKDTTLAARVEAMGQELSRLRHPHLIPVLEAGSVDDIGYLVTVTPPGQSLADLLQAKPTPLKTSTALTFIRQIADALDYIHKAGFVHGDVHPETIIVGYDGLARLDAVGMALLGLPTRDLATAASVTPPDREVPSQPFNIRTDIDQFVALSHRLLTGEPLRNQREVNKLTGTELHTDLHQNREGQSTISRTESDMPSEHLYSSAGAFAQALTDNTRLTRYSDRRRNATQLQSHWPATIDNKASSQRRLRMLLKAAVVIFMIGFTALFIQRTGVEVLPWFDPTNSVRIPDLSSSFGSSAMPTATPTPVSPDTQSNADSVPAGPGILGIPETTQTPDSRLGSADGLSATYDGIDVGGASIVTRNGRVYLTMNEDDTPTQFRLELDSLTSEEETVTWNVSTPPRHGIAELDSRAADGLVLYTPNTNFNGQDTFSITIEDADGKRMTIGVDVTVEAVGDAPNIVQGAYMQVSTEQTTPGEPITVTLDATDPDTADSLVWTIATPPQYGTAKLSTRGKTAIVSYTPSVTYVGSDQFTVRVQDLEGNSDQMTIAVTNGSQTDWETSSFAMTHSSSTLTLLLPS